VECPAGKTSSGSHDASGEDTQCDATECNANEKVVDHVCLECPAGKTSSGSHDASGEDTQCDATECNANEKVVDHVCVECPAGKTSSGSHDASGEDTNCDTTQCNTNEKVVDHVCVECPAGKTSSGSHDASGEDTQCEESQAYLGCFRDDSNRDLKHGPREAGFSITSCATSCCSTYKYFALQQGGWCSCDDTYSTEHSLYGKIAESECGSNRLGGSLANSVFTCQAPPLCTCKSDAVQVDDVNGDYCWLAQSTCTLFNGEVVSARAWEHCNHNGSPQVDCGQAD